MKKQGKAAAWLESVSLRQIEAGYREGRFGVAQPLNRTAVNRFWEFHAIFFLAYMVVFLATGWWWSVAFGVVGPCAALLGIALLDSGRVRLPANESAKAWQQKHRGEIYEHGIWGPVRKLGFLLMALTPAFGLIVLVHIHARMGHDASASVLSIFS